MGSKDKKKASSGTKNPDGRRNGKTWKKDKNKPAGLKTEVRKRRDEEIQRRRERRRQEGMARHAEDLRLAAEAKARLEADREEGRLAAREAQQAADAKAVVEQTQIDDLSESIRWMKSHTKGGRVILEKTLSAQFLSLNQ